jgi:protoporphyrinogen oxidase
VLTEGGRAFGIELHDGTVRRYDAISSSMPLTLLVARLDEAPANVREQAAKLTFRNTILVYLEVAGDSVCQDNWVYIQDAGLRCGRITNFRNWVPQLHGESPNTILAMEYWCNEDEEAWQQSDERLIDVAKRELIATTLVADPSKILNATVVRISRCYPVYRRGYRRILEPIQEYLRTIDGLQVIGRYGAFKYNNQDHSILMGILAADNVLAEAKHDLWAVNCDYNSYQESSRITESGLVSAR